MSETLLKTALLVGASGLVGSQVLSRLLRSPYYQKVVVLTRRPLEIKNTKLTELLFDFDRPDASKVVADDVFCCLGTTIKQAGSQDQFRKVDYEYPLRIAKLAKLNGAQKYLIVTAMGADAKSSIFYNRVKGEVEEELRALQYPALHILRPSLLLGKRDERRMGEKVGEVFMSVLRPVMVGPLKKYRAIDSGRVANAMVTLVKGSEQGSFVHDSAALQEYV